MLRVADQTVCVLHIPEGDFLTLEEIERKSAVVPRLIAAPEVLARAPWYDAESEKRLVFLFRPDSTREQRICVASWARKNGLKAVFVNAINYPET